MNIRFVCQDCGGEAKYDITSGKVVCGICGGTNFSYEIEDRCPKCGGVLSYDNQKDKVFCKACNSIIDEVDNIEKDEYEEHIEGVIDTYECTCPSCGGKVMVTETTASTNCPFCGGSIQNLANLTKAAKPFAVLPFKIDKSDAENAFKKWCKNGIITPSDFNKGDRIKKMQPLFIPFFIYDIEGLGSISYHATKVKSYSRGQYDITETSHYRCSRDVDVFVEKLPCDASKKMDDELMDLLEPFNLDELKEFNIGFLNGVLTEKYDFTDEELLNRAYDRVIKYMQDFADGTMNEYSTKVIENKNVKLKKENSHYILIPVWAVFYNHKGKDYMFAMNGQTGKVVGQPPISKKKMIGIGALITFVLTLLQTLIFLLM